MAPQCLDHTNTTTWYTLLSVNAGEGDRSLKINCAVVGFGQWSSQSSKKYGHGLVLSLCLLILGDSPPGWQLLLKAHPTNARSYLDVRNLRLQSKAIRNRTWREPTWTRHPLCAGSPSGHLSSSLYEQCRHPHVWTARAVPAITDPPQRIMEDTGDPPGSHSPTAGASTGLSVQWTTGISATQ